MQNQFLKKIDNFLIKRKEAKKLKAEFKEIKDLSALKHPYFKYVSLPYLILFFLIILIIIPDSNNDNPKKKLTKQPNKKYTVEKNQLQKLNLPEGKLYHYTKGAKSREGYNLSVNEYETICKSSYLSYSAYNQFVYSSIYPIARDVYRNGGAISNKKVYFNQNQKKCYAEFHLTGLHKGSQFKQNFMGTVVTFEYKKNSRSASVHRMFPLGL